MKKTFLFLLIGSGIISFLLVIGAGLYYFRYLALDRRYTQEGKAYMARRQYDNAIETYTKLAAIHPKSLEAYAGRGSAYYYSERYNEGIADYTHALTLAYMEKSKASCYTWRGMCYAAEKEWVAAIDDYNNALERDPQHWNAFRLRGYACAKLKRFDAALRDADEAIRLHQSASVYYTRGFIYGEMGEHLKALADCRAATERDPLSYSAWADLGWEQYKAGKLDEAESSDRRALELNGARPTPRFNLGLCFSVQNNAAEAKKEYALALADGKDSHRDAALEELRKAQAAHPNTPAIRQSLALFAANTAIKSNAPQKKAQNESRSENAE